ncbi:hypothetical protein Cgig2_010011 [Carnegiea gigantea]|uniref:Uncharacterized protein n=1 Tax=Carnegiea gigantea TaxID=171969 RepID=A0A9Q1JQP1_9CARY|nr:hypothetical protein Cgig2_010011 [Carnegiea gigantea]
MERKSEKFRTTIVYRAHFPIAKAQLVPPPEARLARWLALSLGVSANALPTGDCLFVDPLHGGKTMLKIWNLNKFSGVLGIFNCQEGGWSQENRRNKCFSEYSKLMKCMTRPKDVERRHGHKPFPIKGGPLFAMYLCKENKLVHSKLTDTIEISLEYELITVSPMTFLSLGISQVCSYGVGEHAQLQRGN